ncbi:MAG: enolase-phosphatase [Actinomycetota bacterium]
MTVTFADVSTIVVDIEGTTSKTSHVFEVLFPYARTRIAHWVQNSPRIDVAAVAQQAASLLGKSEVSDVELISSLEKWSDEDVKASPLKTVQGEIWREGFEFGDLTSHLFDDVAPQLHAWHAQGLALHVFSSGSVTAQKSWFSHTDAGNLAALFSGYFDTVTAGNKRETDSYGAIADALAKTPSEILFLTDVVQEADAAEQAGWKVVLLARDGEPHAEAARAQTKFPVVTSFEEINFTN